MNRPSIAAPRAVSPQRGVREDSHILYFLFLHTDTHSSRTHSHAFVLHSLIWLKVGACLNVIQIKFHIKENVFRTSPLDIEHNCLKISKGSNCFYYYSYLICNGQSSFLCANYIYIYYFLDYHFCVIYIHFMTLIWELNLYTILSLFFVPHL